MTNVSRQNPGPNTASFDDFNLQGFSSANMTISLSAVPAYGATVSAKLPTTGLTVDLLVNPDTLRMERKSQTTQIVDIIIPRSYLSDALNKSIDCILAAPGIGTVFGLIKVTS
ncbi:MULTISPECIES: hypothetical protein [unclassified Pseudomonas]|uniref:hypothetical protein n=1 Tax=unclassified Pseudomonas TaxID=196821 RepID=UPI000A1E9F95|nr:MULTISPECIES: hypothetical protein [unclassified Pseudomonas]